MDHSLIYPMDTAWLGGKISADHDRHSRPGYLRALQRAGLVRSAIAAQPVAEVVPPAEPVPPAENRNHR